MNPKKCVFGVFLGKLLGFIVSKRGIKIDPNKAKAIAEMPPPKNIKELRGLIGRLQFIRRFISQHSQRCRPFYELLKGGARSTRMMSVNLPLMNLKVIYLILF